VGTSRYGDSSNYVVDVEGSLINSTFMTGCSIYSNGGILDRVTSIDSCIMWVGGFSSSITQIDCFSFGGLNNNGVLRNCMFGGSRNTGVNDYMDISFDDSCSIYNSIFGAIRSDSTKYVNLKANKLLSKIRYGANGKISGNVYLTHLQTNSDTWGFEINLQTWVDKNPVKNLYGYHYDITGNINDKYVTNLYGTKDLIHELTDELNIVRLITKSTLQ